MRRVKQVNNCCPYCGCEYYYRVTHIKGQTEWYYRFDGEDEDETSVEGWSGLNSHVHDNLQYKANKTMYCKKCDKKVGVAKD